MPRRPRLQLCGLPVHIVQRGNNRTPCFFAEEDYLFYRHWLRLLSARHSCAIHAYALMTNHVHLLLTPDQPEGASALMQAMGRPYGESVWSGKPAGVLGVSVGVIGTALAQQHLRNILAYLDVPTLGQPEVFLQTKEGLFDADGSIGPDSRGFLQDWMDRYVAWVKKHSA